MINKLAIVIPYFKLIFFREALKSLAEQTDQRFTVYIGNDTSPENPEDLLKEFEGQFNFVYKKFDENLGGTFLTKQWERCIDMMQGEEWFMILGDDDYLDVNSVEELYNTVATQTYNMNVLRYNFQIINEKNKSISSEIIYPDNETSAAFISKRAQGLVRNSLSEYVFKTEAYFKYGIISFPKAFYSDNMMVLQYSNFGPIKNITNGKVFIRVSENSISGNQENYKFLMEAGYIFYTRLLTEYSKHFTKKQLSYFLQYAFDGYLLKETNINLLQIFHIIFKNTSYNETFNFVIQLIKNKLFILFKK